MDAEWITSPVARRVLAYFADPRPAWLWSADGSTLIWRNSAARLFGAKVKKTGLRLASSPVPIRGQVARLIRLGSVGRSSLARVQFLAGDRPLATTCTCTPLPMTDGETTLLVVAVDPIAAEISESAGEIVPDPLSETLFPAGWSYRLAEGEPDGNLILRAGPAGETLILTAPLPGTDIEAVRQDEGIETEPRPHDDESLDLADLPEPMLPLGIDPLPVPDAPVEPIADEEMGPVDPDEAGALSSLFDRLASDADLYTPLTSADEHFAGERPEAIAQPAEPPEVEEAIEPVEPDLIAAVIEYADDPETAPPVEKPATGTKSHWMITGRGFRAVAPQAEPPPAAEPTDAPPEPPAVPTPVEADASAAQPVAEATQPTPSEDQQPMAALEGTPDAEADRVSRYNFEELGRILTDRVATDVKAEPQPEPTASQPAAAAAPATGVINLNAETLVLNRLPLAILVFRDQQVLFANRALTDLLGHDGVESLRAAGIASIFPTEDSAEAGPVNRLVRRDGTPLSVTARLQSVSWQGRAALMLSASPSEQPRGHEGAVRAFAEIAASTRGEGYITADRAGVVTFVSAPGRGLLGRNEAELVGKPLAVLLAKSDMDALRAFLEKPARFAETARPSFTGISENGEAEIALFAEGQAGIVSGYFGFARKRLTSPATPATPDDDLEPGLLGRLSRGIRRPLNTIIGFADLIRASGADGPNERTQEYARDIRTAGLEIAVLADELDDFTRLRDGRYAPRPSDIDLTTLLESCMVRVRPQAGAARVLVRSAISEQLPRIRADRTSLGQALLNLLASAIDQTPVGGSVILSAQREEDGGISIHVRDGASSTSDFGERFVVFRDGIDKDGEQLVPVRSSVGLALTRSLLAVNACSLSVDPTATTGTLFSLTIPAEAIVRA